MARAATVMTEDDEDDRQGAEIIDLPNRDDPQDEVEIIETEEDGGFRPLTGPASEQQGDDFREEEPTDDTQGRQTSRHTRRRQEQRRLAQKHEALIARQNEEIAQLKAERDENKRFREEATGRFTSFDRSHHADQISRLDAEIAAAAQTVEQAVARMGEAMSTGDTAAYTKAFSEHNKAFAKGFQLEQRKVALENNPPRQETRQDTRQETRQEVREETRQPRQSPEVFSRAQEFAKAMPWYKFRTASNGTNIGSDNDSRLLLQLDNEVAADGFDPSQDDYWDELEDRLREALPHRFEPQRTARPRTQQTRQTQQTQVPTNRRGPMVGTGSGGAPTGGKRQVKLTPGRKQSLIDIGVLTSDGKIADRKRFDSMLKRYEEIDTSSPEA